MEEVKKYLVYLSKRLNLEAIILLNSAGRILWDYHSIRVKDYIYEFLDRTKEFLLSSPISEEYMYFPERKLNGSLFEFENSLKGYLLLHGKNLSDLKDQTLLELKGVGKALLLLSDRREKINPTTCILQEEA